MPFVDDTVTIGVDGDTRGASAAHNILPSQMRREMVAAYVLVIETSCYGRAGVEISSANGCYPRIK